jgi:hypothetical protein
MRRPESLAGRPTGHGQVTDFSPRSVTHGAERSGRSASELTHGKLTHGKGWCVRRASSRSEWPECQYCQVRERRLYELPLVRPTGELTGLSVCVFCYIRMAGEKPRPRRSSQPERVPL